jgi:predicted ArsR family transcriptional regulator
MAIVRFAHADHAGRLTDPPSAAQPGARRAAVLACLEESAEPVGVATVAERTGLHVNTARFHLDGLVGQGLAERYAEASGSPGRPRILYRPLPRPTGPRSYQLLGRMLAGVVADLDPDGAAADSAGEAWGRELVDASPGGGRDHDGVLVRLDALMTEVGFQPVTTTEPGGGAEIDLHHCPFLEVATERTAVVCGLHRGLMKGALDRLGASLDVAELRPFERPGVCVARLRSR